MGLEKPELWEIPDSWQWSKISELGDVVSGGTPSTKEPAFWGDVVNWITPADLSGYSEKFISKGAKSLTQKGLASSSAKLMPKGSVHFSSRAPVGYVVISKEDMSTNQGFKSIVPTKEGFNEFVYYYLKGAKRLAEERASGTTFKEISGKAFSELPIPLAPFNEQQRIVSKLEELLSELDKGIESFKTAREQLTVYRQAVLKHAFEGKLTEEWRKKHAGELESAEMLPEKIHAEREQRYRQQLDDWKRAVEAWDASGNEGKKPTKPGKPKELPPLTEKELSELPELPEGWGWIRFHNIVLESCLGKMLDKSKNVGTPIPYLRNINVRWGSFDLSDLLNMKFEEAERERYGVQPGDLIICEGGEPGRCAIWKQSNSDMRIQKALHRVRFPIKSIANKFAYYFIFFSSSNGHLSKFFTGTTIKHLTGKGLANLEIPVCSIAEQIQIAQQIESRLSVVEKLEKDIEDGLRQAEALRQSLLKKAFEGKLVSQDPDDEPASVLLERIKTEKAKLKQKARKEKTVAA